MTFAATLTVQDQGIDRCCNCGRGSADAEDDSEASCYEQRFGDEGLCLARDFEESDEVELNNDVGEACGEPGCECCTLGCSVSFGGTGGLAMVSCPKTIRTHCKTCKIHQVRVSNVLGKL